MILYISESQIIDHTATNGKRDKPIRMETNVSFIIIWHYHQNIDSKKATWTTIYDKAIQIRCKLFFLNHQYKEEQKTNDKMTNQFNELA